MIVAKKIIMEKKRKEKGWGIDLEMVEKVIKSYREKARSCRKM